MEIKTEKSKRGRPKKQNTMTALERLKQIAEQQKSLADEAEKLKKEVEIEKYKSIYEVVAESGIAEATDKEYLSMILETHKLLKNRGFKSKSEVEIFINLYLPQFNTRNEEETYDNEETTEEENEEETYDDIETEEENAEEDTFKPTPFSPYTPLA